MYTALVFCEKSGGKESQLHFDLSPNRVNELRTLAAYFGHHRVSRGKVRRNIYMVTLKGQGQYLTSGQGHIHVDLSRSCCLSVDASRQDKHNDTTPMFVALFNRELLAKTCW